jgi:hypothetical protein
VPCPGDVNGDGFVTLIDLLLVVRAFHSPPGDSTWNQRADINGDGRVDMLDLLIVVDSFIDARCSNRSHEKTRDSSSRPDSPSFR